MTLRAVSIFLCSCLLISFSALRYPGVGADDLVYLNFFSKVAPELSDWFFGDFQYSFSELYMEPGYVMLNSLVKSILSDEVFFLLVVSLLSTGVMLLGYYKVEQRLFCLFCMMFFVHTYLYRDMNQIRSAISAAFVFHFIINVSLRKHSVSLLCLLVASLFHIGSLIVIIPYLISLINPSRRFLAGSLLIAILFGYFIGGRDFIGLLPGMGFLSTKIANYVDNSEYVSAVKLFDLTNLKNIFLAGFAICFSQLLSRKFKFFNAFLVFYVFAVCFRVAFYDLGVLAARLSTFLAVGEVIILGATIGVVKQRRAAFLLLCLYCFLVLFMNLNSGNVNEYKFVDLV